MLTDLIKQYFAAQAAWNAKVEIAARDEESQEEWDRLVAAEDAVFCHPCRSLEDAREKARFVLQNESALDTLRNGSSSEGEYCLIPFLQSLLGEPVDKSNNGENRQ